MMISGPSKALPAAPEYTEEGAVNSRTAYLLAAAGFALAAAIPAAVFADHDGSHRLVEGVEIFLGVSSADRLRAQLATARPESSMHGGIPRGRSYYHVDVSLFDARNGSRINNAQVEARVENLRLGGETRRLEPVTINGGVSYGSYFRMPSTEPYAITVRIVRAGEARPVEIRFAPRSY
jgi:hypothetical protein